MKWDISSSLQPTIEFDFLDVLTDIGEAKEIGIVDKYERDGTNVKIWFNRKPVIALVIVIVIITIIFIALMRRRT